MMELLSFYLPTRIRFGPGAIKAVGNEVCELGVRRPLIVTDKTIAALRILEGAYSSLETQGIEYSVFDSVVSEPTTSVVEEAATVGRAEGCNSVIGLGGGSCLDAAKAVAVILTNDKTMHDYLTGHPIEMPPLPVIAIPTTFGTGSEATAVTVIGNPEAGYKKGLINAFFYPSVALVDPELGGSLPPYIAAITGIDAFAHALEAYTSRIATPFSDALAIKALQLIYKHILGMVKEDRGLDVLSGMAVGSTLAGIAFSNASTGLTHTLAERIGVFHALPHGLAVAVLLPYVVEFNVSAASTKYAQIARALGIAEHEPDLVVARSFVKAIRALVVQLGIPSTLREVGVKRGDIPTLVSTAFKGTSTLYNARVANQEDITGIYEAAIGCAAVKE